MRKIRITEQINQSGDLVSPADVEFFSSLGEALHWRNLTGSWYDRGKEINDTIFARASLEAAGWRLRDEGEGPIWASPPTRGATGAAK